MKRYLLLEDNSILDTHNKLDLAKYGKEYNKENFIKQQSDNILDLLEVGDCVEDEVGISDVTDVESEQDYYTNQHPDKLIAIWKRSGDIMRRYEV